MKNVFRKYLLLPFVLLILTSELSAQYDTLRVMTYNTLDFPMSSAGREVYFKTVTQYLNADVILVNELSNATGANLLLNDALNEDGITYWERANFVYGSNLNNMIFYNSDKLELYSQYEISTNVRDINEYVLYYKSDDLATTNDTIFFYFYVAHLKASVDYEDDRLAEVNQFLARLNGISNAENVFFCGDMNIYTSSEPAYQVIINNNPYGFNDPLPAGSWHNNSSYSSIHTQSTRTASFGGGSTGGMDDRFDFILFTDDVNSGSNKVTYIPGTCEAFGNDGNHYNDALIDAPVNPNIPASVTNALYYMSDHLPVFADFRVEANVDTTISNIVITEIMYNPPEAGTDTLEFIELFNNGTDNVNIGGYQFVSGVDFTFPSTDVAPGEFVVVAVNSAAMQNVFGVNSFQWTSGALVNGGEPIELTNSSGFTIDIVNFDDTSPWPTQPDGNGPSLILCNPDSDNNAGANWTYSQNFVTNNGESNPIYATPGFSECGFPPVAGFSASPTTLFVGESVTYTDLSSNNPSSWAWTFEGGSPSTSAIQNPVVFYNSPGIYDVSLMVTNPSGTDEAIYSDYIAVIEESTGTLMITEIMQNPTFASDNVGEWLEVFNPTQSPVNMQGWYLKDNDNDSIKILSSLIVPANGFAVLGCNSNSSTNGNFTCDYQYVYLDYQLSNSADEIVLYNSNEEEIDRVEYDGGSNWPDPSGISMIFTGGVLDDNNNYNNWTTSSLRELSYTGTTGDLGSPGSNGTGQNLEVQGIELDLKVYLEGPFNGIDMNTDLNSNFLIPLSQPYNIAPWNYYGTESVASIPTDVVDWVIVEVRDASNVASATPSTIVAQQSAFLKNDGSIVDMDGSSLPYFSYSPSAQVFVVIWHRNHLGVISNYPLSQAGGIYSYDFTTQADQVLGNFAGYKEIAPGVFGMVGGDGNADGTINSLDKSGIWEAQSGNAGYILVDYNLDGQVDNKDKNDIWINNDTKSEQVPD